VPHFTVVPMVLERSDLMLILPERIARVFALGGKLVALRPPVAIPPAEVAVHWHERFDRDPGNRWLRGQLVELFGA
jgi:DNA-binding transcriptional LysR family regulator